MLRQQLRERHAVLPQPKHLSAAGGLGDITFKQTIRHAFRACTRIDQSKKRRIVCFGSRLLVLTCMTFSECATAPWQCDSTDAGALRSAHAIICRNQSHLSC